MTYYWDRTGWPAIPAPHDRVIGNISFSDGLLVLDLEPDAASPDLLQHIRLTVDPLIVRMHSIDTFDIYQMKIRTFPKFKKTYAEIDLDRSAGLVKRKRVGYLYH